MPYTQQEVQRLQQLHQAIEGRKAHPHAAPTWRDVPDLKETAQIALSRQDTDPETLEDKIAVLGYLASCYDSLCRPAVSARFYRQQLDCYVALCACAPCDGEQQQDFEYALYMAVKTRNHYEPDDCADLLALVQGSLPWERIRAKFEEAGESRRWSIRHDPVEKTEEYLAVIDAVEEEIDRNKTMDFCLETWSLKAQFLARRGIFWKSPVQLNPGVMFD